MALGRSLAPGNTLAVAISECFPRDEIHRRLSICCSVTSRPTGYVPPSSSALISSPVFVVVLPIRLTTTSRFTNGRPRQFSVMWQNSQCSILFHLLVPGGKWHTEMWSPTSSASRCNSTIHSRQRVPLEPPPSAVINSLFARG